MGFDAIAPTVGKIDWKYLRGDQTAFSQPAADPRHNFIVLAEIHDVSEVIDRESIVISDQIIQNKDY